MSLLGNLRFLPLVAAAFFALPACTAESTNGDDDLASSSDELNGGLKSLSILKGSIVEGSKTTIAYEPDLYEPMKTLPFLAIEIESAAEAAAAEAESTNGLQALNGTAFGGFNVEVTGEFPGSPRVLVVDENFRVLSATNGVTTATGDHASLFVPNIPGKKTILVRDMKWVRPMAFEVSVGQ